MPVLNNPLRVLCLLSLLSISAACAQAQEDICQLIYSPIPHKDSGKTTGTKLLGDILSMPVSRQINMFKDVMPLTEMAINELMLPGIIFEIKKHEVIMGGYEGVTSPSIYLEIKVTSSNKIKSLEQIASALGHIYIQDSVLVQCPDAPGTSGSEVVNFTLSDVGTRKFITRKNIPSLYGMMIGAFNTVNGVGYSYYADEQKVATFSVFERENETNANLNAIAEFLADISDGGIRLDIKREIIEVTFPHNDWRLEPQGREYMQNLTDVLTPKDIAPYRERFMKIMGHHTDQEKG